jgi:short-subunit dehydrogenase
VESLLHQVLFCRQFLDNEKIVMNVCRYGNWALVTGATDGIGKAFTVKLARKKINLVIVGRSQSKLEELAKELHSKYGVEV